MQKGCLGKVIAFCLIVITGIAVITGILFGGYVYIRNEMNSQINPGHEELTTRVEKLVNLSTIPAGYSVTKAIDMLGIKAVITEYAKNNQTMAIIEPGWAAKISPQDVKNGSLVQKIEKMLNDTKNDNFRIGFKNTEKNCTLKAFGESVPCIETNFSLLDKNKPEQYKAIIGVVKNTAKNNNYLVLSFNTPDKYNQLVVDQFFKNLKYSRKESENK